MLTFLKNYYDALGADAKPVVAVPTTYNTIYESELHDAGVGICIYANHMLRAAYPSMLNVAQSILTEGRSKEADGDLLGVKEIITLIDKNVTPPESSSAGSAANPNFISGREFSTKVKPASAPEPVVAPPTAPRVDDAPKTKPDPVGCVAHMRSLGVNFFTGVPDSLLAPFCHAVVDSFDNAADGRQLIAANEGSAIATACGHHVATGETPLVYLQNSGLGNTANPIMSLAHKDVYACPMVVMIGWRGAPGTKDEPQHVVQGLQTQAQLLSLDTDTFILPEDDHEAACATLTEAVAAAEAKQSPVAVLVRPKTFAPFTGNKPALGGTEAPGYDARPTREQALSALLDLVAPEDAIVSTTGFTSREVYELREARGEGHDSDFLCVGSMGHASAIAHGVALAQPDRRVWCLDGDGASMMHLGNFATGGSMGSDLSNLVHVVLNNHAHDSVGGQPTAASSGRVDFCGLADAVGYGASSSVDSLAAIESIDTASLMNPNGPTLLEIKLKLGTRKDLGRPKTSTQDCKTNFAKFLQK